MFLSHTAPGMTPGLDHTSWLHSSPSGFSSKTGVTPRLKKGILPLASSIIKLDKVGGRKMKDLKELSLTGACVKVCFILVSFFCCPAFAQMQSNIEAMESGGSLSHYNMIGRKLPAPEMRGDYNLFDDWITADIHLKDNKTVKGQQLNFNLQTEDIEIPYEDDIRVLNRSKIQSITFENRTFINTKVLNPQGDADRFFELIEDGGIAIYCKYYTSLREPTYIPGLAVGDKNYKVLKKKEYYVYDSSKLELFKRDRKVNLSYFKKSAETLNFIKSEKLRLSKIEDFIKATRLYNDLNK